MYGAVVFLNVIKVTFDLPGMMYQFLFTVLVNLTVSDEIVTFARPG